MLQFVRCRRWVMSLRFPWKRFRRRRRRWQLTKPRWSRKWIDMAMSLIVPTCSNIFYWYSYTLIYAMLYHVIAENWVYWHIKIWVIWSGFWCIHFNPWFSVPGRSWKFWRSLESSMPWPGGSRQVPWRVGGNHALSGGTNEWLKILLWYLWMACYV